MSKILYVGDSAIKAVIALEGFDAFSFLEQIWDAGTLLQSALEACGHKVIRMLSHEAFHNLPETAEELADFDVLILSDISHDSILLYPGPRRNNVPMGRNRMKEIVRYVQNGGGLAYLGGYFTYQGYHGKGRWYDTPVAKILPVEIQSYYDDRVETPEGARMHVLNTDHPIWDGISLNSLPVFMGYNKTLSRPGAELLAQVGEDNDPLLACWEFGKGRVVAFTSDAAPHWGSDFIRWTYYQRFWNQVIVWLSGK